MGLGVADLRPLRLRPGDAAAPCCSGTNRRLALPARRPHLGLGRRGDPRGVPAVARGLHESMRPERPGTMVARRRRLGVRDLRHGVRPRRRLGAAPRPALRRGRRRRRVRDVPLQGGVRRPSPRARCGSRRCGPRTPTAYASLWRYLLDLDLARTFQLWSAPLDEPLRHLVTDARAVETDGHRQPLRARGRRRGRAPGQEVRRRRRPGHRGRRPDPARRTPAATGSSPTATPRARRPR